MIRRCDSDFRSRNWDLLPGWEELSGCPANGLSKALPMLLTGKEVGAKEAFQIELVDAVACCRSGQHCYAPAGKSIPTGIPWTITTRCFVQAGTAVFRLFRAVTERTDAGVGAG